MDATISTVNDKVGRVEEQLQTLFKEMRDIKSVVDQVLQVVLGYPTINAQNVSSPSVWTELSTSDDDDDDHGENSIIHSAPDINASSGNINIDSGELDQSESDADENYFSDGNSEGGILVDSAGEIVAPDENHEGADSDTALLHHSATLSDEKLINDSHEPSLVIVRCSGGNGESGNGSNIGSTPTYNVDDDDEVEIIEAIDKRNLLGRTVVRDAMSSAPAQPVHVQIPLVTIDGGLQIGGDFTACRAELEPEISDLNTIFESESTTQGKLSVGSERSTRPPRKRESGSTSDKAKTKRIRGIRQAPVEKMRPGTRSSFLDNVLSQQSSRGNSSSNPSTSANSAVIQGGLLKLDKIKREAHALQHFDQVTNMWVCICGHETHTKIGLNLHVREHGTEVPRYKCPDCLQRFKFVYKMKKHLMTVHGYRDLPRDLPCCKICFKVVVVTEQLINHRNESGKLCIPRRLRKAGEASSDTSGDGAVIPEPRQEPKVPSIIIRLPRPAVDDDNFK